MGNFYTYFVEWKQMNGEILNKFMHKNENFKKLYIIYFLHGRYSNDKRNSVTFA